MFNNLHDIQYSISNFNKVKYGDVWAIYWVHTTWFDATCIWDNLAHGTLKLKVIHLYSTPFRQCPTKSTSHTTCNSWAEALSTMSFLCDVEPPPCQLPGEHTGHETASRCHEPIQNAHCSSTHPHCWYSFNLTMKGWRVSQPYSTDTSFSRWSSIQVLTGPIIA